MIGRSDNVTVFDCVSEWRS